MEQQRDKVMVFEERKADITSESLTLQTAQYSGLALISAMTGLAKKSVNSCMGDFWNLVSRQSSGVRKPYVDCKAAKVACKTCSMSENDQNHLTFYKSLQFSSKCVYELRLPTPHYTVMIAISANNNSMIFPMLTLQLTECKSRSAPYVHLVSVLK